MRSESLVGDLDHGLAKRLAGEHVQEGAVGRLQALVLGVARLYRAVGNVLGHVLLEAGNVGLVDVVVPVDEAADGDALAEDVRQVRHSVLLLLGLVVLRGLIVLLVFQSSWFAFDMVLAYHSADDDPSEPIQVVNGSLEVLSSDVLVHDVEALGGKPLEGARDVLLAVVEAGVGAEHLGDVLELLGGADTGDNAHALLLGELDDDLTDRAGGGVDPDGLALLGLDQAVERIPGRHAGQAERAHVVRIIEVVLVLDLPDEVRGHDGHVDQLLGDDTVLGDGQETLHQVTLLEVGVVRLDHPGDGKVGDGLIEVVSRDVALEVGTSHAVTLVRVEAGDEYLDNDTSRRRSQADGPVLEDGIKSKLGETLGDLLVDPRLVLYGVFGHFERDV